MSKSVLRCENVPSIVGALKRCEKGRHSRGASTMAYCASMMQENALFDTSAERQVVVEEGAHALEVATSIKSALDQRISRLESVVEDLSGEVVYLRRRLSCFEGPNETRFNSDASHLAQSSLLTVQPWEDPPKGQESACESASHDSLICNESSTSLEISKPSNPKTWNGREALLLIFRRLTCNTRFTAKSFGIGTAVIISCLVASISRLSTYDVEEAPELDHPSGGSSQHGPFENQQTSWSGDLMCNWSPWMDEAVS